jgi:hypothetical protein
MSEACNGGLDFNSTADVSECATTGISIPVFDCFVMARLKNRKGLFESGSIDVGNIMAQHLEPVILNVRSCG